MIPIKASTLTFLLLSLFIGQTWSQVIPSENRIDWSQAGCRFDFPDSAPQVSIISFGGVADGITNNTTPLNDAMASFSGYAGIIYFPPGSYVFSSLIDIPDSIWLKGAGSDSTFIKLAHSGTGFNFSGSATNSFTNMISGFQKGSHNITVANPGLFADSNYCEIRQDNGSWDVNPAAWATYSVGQIVQIESIIGDTLVLFDELHITFDAALNPQIQKINPRKASGISCMNVERTDNSIQGTGYNFGFNFAVNCQISGIESNKSQGSHCMIGLSSHISVSGCYFHDAFVYDGSGTKGYGVTLNEHACLCLIQNNIFNRLRHAMMTKHGANGNVLAYNYSRNPYRDGNFEYPQDYSGDISLHGHYSFANLFEGNIVQNIYIDQIWGPSGPYNTFLRNRTELYGIVMSSDLTNYQNFVGNEITGTGSTWPFLHGAYSINGSGHIQYGNNQNGIIIPAGTTTLNENSYYLDTGPVYWSVSQTWPDIGIPNTLNTGTIPAKERYNAGKYTDCSRQSILTYTWNVASGNWTSPASWFPKRTAPAANDILIFDGRKQTSSSVTLDVSAENIGRLRFINDAAVTLTTAAASGQINAGVSGSVAPQFEITSGASLIVNAANPVAINLPAGYVASVSGDIVFQDSAHRMTAVSINGITFNNGASFTAGSNFSGNAFGSGTANSVNFTTGSRYIQNGGSNPFGATAPGSVVLFETGSLYTFTAASGAPDLSGRTYGNLEINSSSADLSSMSGEGSLTVQDLTITAGDCGFNLTGTINLKGNISVASGASLNFNPALPDTVYLNGTPAQQISGDGSIICGENSTITSANSNGVKLDNAVTFNNLTISSGNFIIASGASLITNGTISGNAMVERNIANDNAWHFLSSPVASQAIQPDFAPAVMNNTFDFYYWDPMQNQNTGLPWVNLRNESGGLNNSFDPENPGTPQFKTGFGYLVAYSPVYDNPNSAEAIKVFDGKLHSGTVAVHLLFEVNPWNLIGNPFPSSVDFIKFNTAAGPALGSPAYWTVLPDGSYASYLAGTGGVNGASKYLAPTQGFFVKAAASADIDFNNDMRSHNNQEWLNEESDLPNQLRFQLANINYTTNDEVLIHKSPLFDGTTGAEKLLSMGSGASNLFTVKADKKFCIDQVSDTTQSLILGFIPAVADNYTITLTSNSFPASGIITLEDLQAGKKQDLQIEPVYPFAASPDDEISRFVLHFNSTNGAQEEISKKDIYIYGAGKTLNVNQSTPQNGLLAIFSATGQLVVTKSLAPFLSQSVNLDYLDAGMYLISIISSRKAVYYEKVIIR